MEPIYFVYTKGMRGPAAEIWYGDRMTGTDRFKNKPVGQEDSPLLYFRKLEGEDRDLTLAELKIKFPYVEGFVYTGAKT